MNPNLSKLQSYPFEKLAKLKADIEPPANRAPISLYIGEPKHPAPDFIKNALSSDLSALSRYPLTKGSDALREALGGWLNRRYRLPAGSPDPAAQVLPLNGTREGLFAFAQCVADGSMSGALVLMPNPFYQIYEGAALLAEANPWFVNSREDTGFIPDFAAIPEAVWARCQLLYICSPANPTGAVMDIDTLQSLIRRADEYDFIIAADECYSEIYADEAAPPPGLLQASAQMGRTDYKRCVVFNSLSKRSNVPGLRSGLAAGDADVLRAFLQYRTYHGCTMSPPVQTASIAAWNDETHVRANRALYREKFEAVIRILAPEMKPPSAGFYLWPETPVADEVFTRELFARENVTVLPGSYLSRTAQGINPGYKRVRIALVAPRAECVEAAVRIRRFLEVL